MSPAVQDLLVIIRQHAGFQDFMKAMPQSVVPRFKRSKAPSDAAQTQQWIYDSGRADQYDATIRFLTGDPDVNLTENGDNRNG